MTTTRRVCRWLVATAVAASLAACGLPHHKSLEEVSKPGASLAVADLTLASYARERAAADQALDVDALGDLESGAVLDIDTSSFLVRRALGISARPFVLDESATVWAPSFRSYPLWFVAFTRLPEQQEQVALVFTRASSIDPWLVEAAPRLAGDTAPPFVALGADGTAARLARSSASNWSDGEVVKLDATPQQIVARYADVLTSAKSKHADEFVKDSFITQMREVRRAQPSKQVRFSQRWSASPVRYVLRLADGGALMFVTLRRVDRFEVRTGKSLNFAGSEAGAYLPNPIRHKARLDYRHQVLMVVPADDAPLVIGQYGGLVAAKGR